MNSDVDVGPVQDKDVPDGWYDNLVLMRRERWIGGRCEHFVVARMLHVDLWLDEHWSKDWGAYPNRPRVGWQEAK